MLVTSLLEDIDMVTEDNREEVIDPSKVFRGKQATRMNQTFDIPLTDLIYFNGKRDATLKIQKIFSKSYKRKLNRDHIVIESGSHYAGNLTPQTGSAKNICT